MKWKIPPHPKQGDTRKRRKFAWFPTFVTSFENTRYKVWLETYLVTEVYVKSTSIVDGRYYWLKIHDEPLFGEYESDC